MATYIMFGKYSLDAVKKISAERTEKADALIKANGGTLKAAYAVLGEYDLILIAEFPGTEQAMKVSVEAAKAFGISFVTAPAVSVETFDKMMG
ncbi:MAG TPA: GYD domain-containing protein [Anaerolineae bacterium]|jgi:uncharacterized protein with GYD domain|nr:GYD domain-containing protein [Anaerolineae bacterium]